MLLQQQALTTGLGELKQGTMHCSSLGGLMMRRRVRRSRQTGAERRWRMLIEFLQMEYAARQGRTGHEAVSTQLEIGDVSQMTRLSQDLLSEILVRVPGETLFQVQFSCKKWYGLINSSVFVRCQAQQCDKVLLSQNVTLLEPISNPLYNDDDGGECKSFFHYLDLGDGTDGFMESGVVEVGDVKASCDGLVLATMGKGEGLILMNPVTRKHTVLPLGTDAVFHGYGIAFCKEAKTYKVAHLFHEKTGHRGCEILSMSTRKWTRIDVPHGLLMYTRHMVSIEGSLYWTPRKYSSDFFVVMNMEDEKFDTKKLPVVCVFKDRLIEIGGRLGFVSGTRLGVLQVWIMAEEGGMNELWRHCYSINVSSVGHPLPLCSTKNGKEIVLESTTRCLYLTNLDTGEIKQVRSRTVNPEWSGDMDSNYIPHRNTLASWDDHIGNYRYQETISVDLVESGDQQSETSRTHRPQKLQRNI
ncbi:probable F-box protein At5g47300 [Andrographis paniculata]|uniref:probable F-box protein At5g47300 n=1 Tax=Andrographis paniculata TaxID=175694 RepID=UPI0021E83405|nr:probable F-box protein At5g47300 [Andrographis paniculata]